MLSKFMVMIIPFSLTRSIGHLVSEYAFEFSNIQRNCKKNLLVGAPGSEKDPTPDILLGHLQVQLWLSQYLLSR